MKINNNLILRQVGDEYMIVNPFSNTVDMTQVYSLNETAAWIWEQMKDKEFTLENMVQLLQEEYDVDESTATADLSELCQEWKKVGLMIE